MDDSNEKSSSYSSMSNVVPNNQNTIKSISLNMLNSESYNLNDGRILDNNNENSISDNLNEKIVKLLIGDHPLLSMKTIEKIAHCNFMNQHFNDKDFYNIKVIDEIIHNESSHIVAEFKDYLIKGDISEFLQQYYKKKESLNLLPKIYEYYISCSVIFPNYVILPESQYIYKNIQRKQRVIDIQQEQEDKEEDIKNGLIKQEKGPTVFNTQAFDSILNQTDTSGARQYFGISSNTSKGDNDMMKLLNNIEKAEKKINLNNPKKNRINVCKLRKGNNNEIIQYQKTVLLNEGGYSSKILNAFNKKNDTAFLENKNSINNDESNQNRNSLKIILRQNTENNRNLHTKRNNHFSTQITYINSCNNNLKNYLDINGIESIKKLDKNGMNSNNKSTEKNISRQLYKNTSETFQSLQNLNSNETNTDNNNHNNNIFVKDKIRLKQNSEISNINQTDNKHIKKEKNEKKNICKEFIKRNSEILNIDNNNIKTYSKDPFKNSNQTKESITSYKTKSQSRNKNKGFKTSRNKYDNKKMYINVTSNNIKSNISNYNNHQSLDAEVNKFDKKNIVSQNHDKHNNLKNNLLNALLGSGNNNQRQKINRYKNILIQKDISDSFVDSIEIKNIRKKNNVNKINKENDNNINIKNKEKEYNGKSSKTLIYKNNHNKKSSHNKRILSASNLDFNNKKSTNSQTKLISINSNGSKHKNLGINLNSKNSQKQISMSKIPNNLPENKMLSTNEKSKAIIDDIDNKNKIKEFINNYLDDYFSSKNINNNFNNTLSRNFHQENNNNFFKSKNKSKNKSTIKNETLSVKNFHDNKKEKKDNIKIRNSIFNIEKGISKKLSEKNFYLFDKFNKKSSPKNRSTKKTSSVCSNKSGIMKNSGDLLSARDSNSKYQMNAQMIELLTNKIQKIKQSIKEVSDKGSSSISSIFKKKIIPSKGRKSFIITKKTEDFFEKKTKNKTRNKKNDNGLAGITSSNSKIGLSGNIVNSIINSIYQTNLLSPDKKNIEYEKLIKTFQKFKRPTNSFIGSTNSKTNYNSNNNYINSYAKKDSKRKKKHDRCNSIYGFTNNYENHFNIEVKIKNSLRATSKKSLNNVNIKNQNDNLKSLNINFNNYTNNYNYNYNIDSMNNMNNNCNKGNINFNNINYNNSFINKGKSSSQKLLGDKNLNKNEINFNGIPINGFENIITKKYNNNRNYNIPISITDRINKPNIYSTSNINNNINSTRYKNSNKTNNNNKGYLKKK